MLIFLARRQPGDKSSNKSFIFSHPFQLETDLDWGWSLPAPIELFIVDEKLSLSCAHKTSSSFNVQSFQEKTSESL